MEAILQTNEGKACHLKYATRRQGGQLRGKASERVEKVEQLRGTIQTDLARAKEAFMSACSHARELRVLDHLIREDSQFREAKTETRLEQHEQLQQLEEAYKAKKRLIREQTQERHLIGAGIHGPKRLKGNDHPDPCRVHGLAHNVWCTELDCPERTPHARCLTEGCAYLPYQGSGFDEPEGEDL